MRREFHVRFCEGGGVRLPSATRLVMVFVLEADARMVKDMLAERLGRHGLSLHPTKTRLLECRPRRDGAKGTDSRSFDFLGFTHYWTRSLRGSWVVKRKTAASRFRRTLKRLSEWCQRNRHRPVAWQHERLVKALRGHYNYFGVVGNWTALDRLHRAVRVIWRKWLNRRSQHNHMPWERFAQLLKRYPLLAPVMRH
jgi:RNA-directed DNA polymerase